MSNSPGHGRASAKGDLWRPDWIAVLLAFAVAVGLAASCDGGGRVTDPADGAIFVIRTCRGSEHAPEGEVFRVLTDRPEVIADGTSLIGAGNVKIVSGFMAVGSGGFNAPWPWHLIPDTVSFVDLAAEICDACPIHTEEAVRHWIETVGNYCPWSTEVLRRER